MNSARLFAVCAIVSGALLIPQPVIADLPEQAIRLNGGTGPQEFPALKDMRSAWGDMDGDGDFDLVLMGATPGGPVTKLYENVRDAIHPFAFEERPSGLPQWQDGALAWGDVDGDGDLDLAMTGANSAAPGVAELHATVLQNNGWNANRTWSFTALATPVPPCRWGTASWADVDNDGDMDLFLSGSTSADTVPVHDRVQFSRIFLNQGGGLTASGPHFPGPRALLAGEPSPSGESLTSRVTWSDVNGDGYQDVFLITDDSGPRVVPGAGTGSGGDHREEVWINTSAASTSWRRLGTPLSGRGFREDLFEDLFSHTGVPGGVGDWDADGRMDMAILGTWALLDENGSENLPVPDWSYGVSWHQQQVAQPQHWIPGFSHHEAAQMTIVLNHTVADVKNTGAVQWLGAALTHDPLPVLTVLGGTPAGELLPVAAISQPVNILPRYRGVLDAVDVDGDGRLDILHSGYVADDVLAGAQGEVGTRFYRNGGTTNARPAAPGGLTITQRTPTSVRLRWDPPLDAETRPAALRYAVRLYRVGDTLPRVHPGCLIRPNDAALDGRRLTPGFSATINGTEFLYETEAGRAMPDGTWRWSVQAIDSGGMGSVLAPEQEFTVNQGVVDAQVETSLPYGETALDVGDYNNDGRLDAVVAGVLLDGFSTQVMRNASTYFVSQATLPALRRGAMRWGDLDGDGDLDLALSGESGGQPITRVYRNDAGTLRLRDILDGVTNSALEWADYDRDGDLDLLVTGYRDEKPMTRLYRNGGENNSTPGIFDQQPTNLPDVGAGAMAWGDFDGDGDLDLLLCGDQQRYDQPLPVFNPPPYALRPANVSYMAGNPDGPRASPVTLLLRNDGLDTGPVNPRKWMFIETPAGLPAVQGSGNGLFVKARAEWCDLNADGLPDLVLGGLTSVPGYPGYGAPSVRIYRNGGANAAAMGEWIFAPSPELLTGPISRALQSVTCADWDGDGFADVLLSGRLNGAGSIGTQIVHNEGMQFTRHSFLRTRTSSGEQFAAGLAAFGHFNGDARPDVLLSGFWGIQSLNGPPPPRRGVPVGSSSLIGALDYSDTFTTDSALGQTGRPLYPAGGTAAAFFVENTHGHPAVSLDRQAFSALSPFRFVSDGHGQSHSLFDTILGHPIYVAQSVYPGIVLLAGAGGGVVVLANASGAGSGTGFFEITGAHMNYGIPMAATGRNEYVVQVDAVQTNGHVRIFSGPGVGSGIPAQDAVAVIFRGDGSGSVALGKGVFETTINGMDSGITGPWQWYNYAVRFNRPGNLLEIFVNQVSRGTVALQTFNGGGFSDFSTAWVAVGATAPDTGVGSGEGRFWTDNFQVGGFALSPLPEPARTWDEAGTLFYNPAPVHAPPSAPTGLSAVVQGNKVTLSWQPATDDWTPAAGLSYNLSVTRTNGAAGGMPGMAHPVTGTRLICRTGNAGYRTTWTLENVPAGTYRWSVQALDAALATSPFTSAAQNFSVGVPVPPVFTALPPLHQWHVGNPATAAVDLLGVAAARNARLIVGRRGRILLSRRNGPFIPVEPGIFTDLYDVIITAEGATAVGDEGVILTSADGVIWQRVPSGTVNSLRAVARGSSGWVAAGNGVVLHSTDRATWTAGTLPAGALVNKVLWAFNRWIAAGTRNGTGLLLASSDGLTWTETTPAGLDPGTITGLATDGAKAVATGGDSAAFRSDVFSSTDGLAWTVQSDGGSPMTGITHTTQGWYAVESERILGSADAVGWTPLHMGGGFLRLNLGAVAAADGMLTAAGAAGVLFDSPIPATAFTQRGGNTVNTYGKEPEFFASLGSLVVAAGEMGIQHISYDSGQTWQGAAYLVGDGFYGLSAGSGRIVRSFYQGLDHTTDGVTWTRVNLNPDRLTKGLAFGNGRFVAARAFGGFYVSTTGLTWDPVSLTTPEAKALAFGNGRFMALDDSGNVRTSVDGASWSTVSTVTAPRLHFARDRFFALNGDLVRTSTDGVSWQTVNGLPAGVEFTAVAWHRDRYILTGGPDALLLTSPDLAVWTRVPIPASGKLNAAYSHDAGLFIAGSNQALLLSLDTSPATTPPPRPVTLTATGQLSPNLFAVTVAGGAGQIVTLERSPDLSQWTAVATFTLAGGTETLEVQIPAPLPSEYFRLRWQP